MGEDVWCPYCGQVTHAMLDFGSDLEWDGEHFIDVFCECCNHCDQTFKVEKIYTYTETITRQRGN